MSKRWLPACLQAAAAAMTPALRTHGMRFGAVAHALSLAAQLAACMLRVPTVHPPAAPRCSFTCTTFWPEYVVGGFENCGPQYNASVGLCLDGMNACGLAVAALGVFQPVDAAYSECAFLGRAAPHVTLWSTATLLPVLLRRRLPKPDRRRQQAGAVDVW